MSTGYKFLVLLHLLCIIGGFGALAYNALYVSLAQRRPGGDGAAAIAQANTLVSSLAELLVYAALLFGIAAVAASHSTVKFSDGWVSAAFGLYLADITVLHAWIRPRQRRFTAGLIELERSGADPSLAQSQGATLRGLEKQVSAGWGVFNLIVVVVVYLMVFKPGG